MKSARPLRIPLPLLVGVLATPVLAIWGATCYYDLEAAAQQQYRDPYMIAASAERFSGLRQAVPEDAVLGYLTDAAPGQTALTIFDTAQYALAPRLLATDTNHRWVLGNFTKPLDFAAMGASHGLHLERDFGNGVVLYRKQVIR
jgi:hypothetical protein